MRELNDLLDHFAKRIQAGDGTEVVSELCDDLRRRRAAMTPDVWANSVVGCCREHPIQSLLLEDPYTARAYNKPRGYAGDAVMLDYVYTGAPPPDTSAVGLALFRGTTGLPNGQSVIARRDLLAQRIDEAAASRPGARVLSIACGHLREAQRSVALVSGTVSELVAFDQDTESLDVVSRDRLSGVVRTIRGSVTDIIRNRVSFAEFDLVYAAGLFDYLTEAFGRRLLALMAGMVRSGGRVLVANFTPDNHGRGYMECFMDWSLTCRDESKMLGLLGGVESGLVGNHRVHRDAYNNVVYLEFGKP